MAFVVESGSGKWPHEVPIPDAMTHSPVRALYRGSPKHKNRPTGERKGTLCPEWTHRTIDGGYRHHAHAHAWRRTHAQRLFEESEASAGSQERFATAKGIAFEAKPTGDGSWHGFPVPWESVPPEIVARWVAGGKVTRREIKKHLQKDDDDLHWAMERNEA